MSNAFDSFDSWVISLGCWIVKKSNYTWWWQGFLSFLLRYKWRFKEWQHVHSLGYILSASCWQIILSIYNHFSVWVWNVLIILALIEYHFSSAQSFSSVWLFATPWTTACQASLSITNSQIYPNTCPLSQWCHPTISSLSPSPPALNLSQHQGLFKWVSSLHQVAKVLEFQLQH